eukprot:GHUV01017757.1.p1 GENE.GHUV01017757.1~~GHUV01017757.1.p1  ORF type:complete len:145 (+),score=7.37 GHUV01017757.1:2808-3242(+)
MSYSVGCSRSCNHYRHIPPSNKLCSSIHTLDAGLLVLVPCCARCVMYGVLHSLRPLCCCLEALVGIYISLRLSGCGPHYRTPTLIGIEPCQEQSSAFLRCLLLRLLSGIVMLLQAGLVFPFPCLTNEAASSSLWIVNLHQKSSV